MGESCNLIVNYLPSNIRDEDLRQIFTHCGIVRSAKVMMDLATRTSKGYGFVMMNTVREARRAIETLDNMHVYNKRLRVKYAVKTATAADNATQCGTENTNLYVKGIPPSWTQLELREFFLQWGEIANAIVLMDRFTGTSKCLAFVEYGSIESARRAMQEGNASSIPNWPQPLIVRYARKERGTPDAQPQAEEIPLDAKEKVAESAPILERTDRLPAVEAPSPPPRAIMKHDPYSMPFRANHRCQYCENGATSVRVYNLPTAFAQCDIEVRRLIGSFGVISNVDCCGDGTCIVTFVEECSAAGAVESLGSTEYAVQIYDCQSSW